VFSNALIYLSRIRLDLFSPPVLYPVSGCVHYGLTLFCGLTEYIDYINSVVASNMNAERYGLNKLVAVRNGELSGLFYALLNCVIESVSRCLLSDVQSYLRFRGLQRLKNGRT